MAVSFEDLMFKFEQEPQDLKRWIDALEGHFDRELICGNFDIKEGGEKEVYSVDLPWKYNPWVSHLYALRESYYESLDEGEVFQICKYVESRYKKAGWEDVKIFRYRDSGFKHLWIRLELASALKK